MPPQAGDDPLKVEVKVEDDAPTYDGDQSVLVQAPRCFPPGFGDDIQYDIARLRFAARPMSTAIVNAATAHARNLAQAPPTPAESAKAIVDFTNGFGMIIKARRVRDDFEEPILLNARASLGRFIEQGRQSGANSVPIDYLTPILAQLNTILQPRELEGIQWALARQREKDMLALLTDLKGDAIEIVQDKAADELALAMVEGGPQVMEMQHLNRENEGEGFDPGMRGREVKGRARGRGRGKGKGK